MFCKDTISLLLLFVQVYATKATAEIGRMMMEELVLLHAEFIQSHGRLETSGLKPPWLSPSLLCTLPEHMRGSSLSRCFSNRANWQPLYRFEFLVTVFPIGICSNQAFVFYFLRLY